MNEEQTITPSTERKVDFYGDTVLAAQDDAGKIFVPLRQLADNLGIAFGSQTERIRRDPVLSAKLRYVEMHAPDGRRLRLLCLPLEMIPGWLFGISNRRVKPELQERLNRYRAECFDVLWAAFKDDILPSAPLTPTTSIASAEQTLEMAAVVYHLAQQQVEMEKRLGSVEGKQQTMAEYMRGFIADTRGRLTALELRLDPTAQITEEQQADLVIAVKTLAAALEAHGKVGSYPSGYARVYTELYRRYNVKSYKNLRRDRFDAAIAWIREWYDEVTTNE